MNDSQSRAQTRVAVLGLGAMGLPMARHLATVAQVHGFDPNGERSSLADECGITTHTNGAAAATDADVVLLAVRNGAQLDDVLFGTAGIASSLRTGAVVLMTSTVGIEPVKAAAAQLADLGVDLVDAQIGRAHV